MNFVNNEILKMWILWKGTFWNCEFCEKEDFENVNFVKREILKMWIFGYIENFWFCSVYYYPTTVADFLVDGGATFWILQQVIIFSGMGSVWQPPAIINVV